jgi:hypothetical protein
MPMQLAPLAELKDAAHLMERIESRRHDLEEDSGKSFGCITRRQEARVARNFIASE